MKMYSTTVAFCTIAISCLNFSVALSMDHDETKYTQRVNIFDYNLYEILRVTQAASLQEIKKAYRELIRQNHPDKMGNNPVAAELVRKINQAYEILRDQRIRDEYDRFLAASKPSSHNNSAQAGLGEFDILYQAALLNSNSDCSALFDFLRKHPYHFGSYEETEKRVNFILALLLGHSLCIENPKKFNSILDELRKSHKTIESAVSIKVIMDTIQRALSDYHCDIISRIQAFMDFIPNFSTRKDSRDNTILHLFAQYGRPEGIQIIKEKMNQHDFELLFVLLNDKNEMPFESALRRFRHAAKRNWNVAKNGKLPREAVQKHCTVIKELINALSVTFPATLDIRKESLFGPNYVYIGYLLDQIDIKPTAQDLQKFPLLSLVSPADCKISYEPLGVTVSPPSWNIIYENFGIIYFHSLAQCKFFVHLYRNAEMKIKPGETKVRVLEVLKVIKESKSTAFLDYVSSVLHDLQVHKPEDNIDEIPAHPEHIDSLDTDNPVDAELGNMPQPDINGDEPDNTKPVTKEQSRFVLHRDQVFAIAKLAGLGLIVFAVYKYCSNHEDDDDPENEAQDQMVNQTEIAGELKKPDTVISQETQ